jgi:hypothetical protein
MIPLILFISNSGYQGRRNRMPCNTKTHVVRGACCPASEAKKEKQRLYKRAKDRAKK